LRLSFFYGSWIAIISNSVILSSLSKLAITLFFDLITLYYRIDNIVFLFIISIYSLGF
jgi:hypothetical protein